MNMNQASNFVKIRKEKILIDVNYTTDIMLNFKIGKKTKKKLLSNHMRNMRTVVYVYVRARVNKANLNLGPSFGL